MDCLDFFEKNINSEMIISFIDKFSEKIEKKTVLLMDQATIHTSDKIMEKIEEWKEKNLEIFWLPAYSPKLNLIETDSELVCVFLYF